MTDESKLCSYLYDINCSRRMEWQRAWRKVLDGRANTGKQEPGYFGGTEGESVSRAEGRGEARARLLGLCENFWVLVLRVVEGF